MQVWVLGFTRVVWQPVPLLATLYEDFMHPQHFVYNRCHLEAYTEENKDKRTCVEGLEYMQRHFRRRVLIVNVIGHELTDSTLRKIHIKTFVEVF